MRIKIFFLSLIIASSLLFTSCEKNQEESFDNGLTLRIATYNIQTSNFHPTTAVCEYEKSITHLIYEPLLKRNDGCYSPVLAERYFKLSDGKSVIFMLKPQIKWQNGALLTSSDVKFSIIKNFEAALSRNSSLTNDTKTVNYDDAIADVFPKITLMGEHTIKVSSQRGCDYVLNEIGAEMLIFPEAVTSIHDDNYTTGDDYRSSFIGTGAFCFTDFSANTHVRLIANSNYWGDPFGPERIVFKDIGNEDPFYLMEKGSINIVKKSVLNEADITNAENANAQIFKASHQSQLSLLLNNNSMYLKNKSFRQALMYSINRDRLAPTFNSTLSDLLLADDTCDLPSGPKYKFDTKHAEQLLTMAECQKEKGILLDKYNNQVKLRLIYTGQNELTRLYPALIKNDFSKMGIVVQTVLLSQGEYERELQSGNYEMALMITQPMSKYEMAEKFNSEHGAYFNLTHYKNPLVDIYAEKIITGNSEDSDCSNILEQLSNDLPVIPILNYNDVYFISDGTERLVDKNNFLGK